MIVSFLYIALGIGCLVWGGDLLIRGAVGLAFRFRLTPAVIGLTVVAAGTSVPELAVSGVAAFQGKVDIAVGNVVGSNIFNVAIILGLCAVIRPLVITSNTTKLEYPVLAIVTLLCVVLVQDGEINRLDAILCLTIYVAFMIYLVTLVREQVTATEARELKEEVEELQRHGQQRLIVSIGLVALGSVLLAGGAHFTVLGASELARLLGWTERLIGLTIVSMGTGLPEVVTSVVSMIRGRSDVAIGNVIGSNLFNTLVILGVSGLFAPLPVQAALVASDCWWMLGVTLVLFPMMFSNKRISRWEGALLLGIYGVYLGLLLSE